jgi:hypothetical protein
LHADGGRKRIEARRTMRRINEDRTATLHASASGTVEGVMHVRGFDATAHRRGARFERRYAGAVTVRRGGDVRVIAIPRKADAGRRLIILAMPLAALVIGHLSRRGRTR